MNKAKKKVMSGILGVSLSVMLAGSCVFAADGAYKTLSGDGGTYTKGSGSGYVVKVDGPFSEFDSVTVDGKTIVKDKDYSVSGKVSSDSKKNEEKAETNTSKEPETSDAPETSEAPEVSPAPTTEAPAPTTEAPQPTPAPTTEAPQPTPAPTTEAPQPTPAPTTEAPQPTPAPTTEAPQPTPAPTTEAPQPTPAPTTEAPQPTPGIEIQNTENGKSVYQSIKNLWKSIFSPVDVQAADSATTVKVFSSYMDTLSVGTHKIAVNFENGTGTATVTVKANGTATNSSTPKTGDTAGITMYAILAMISGGALVVFGRKRILK